MIKKHIVLSSPQLICLIGNSILQSSIRGHLMSSTFLFISIISIDSNLDQPYIIAARAKGFRLSFYDIPIVASPWELITDDVQLAEHKVIPGCFFIILPLQER